MAEREQKALNEAASAARLQAIITEQFAETAGLSPRGIGGRLLGVVVRPATGRFARRAVEAEAQARSRGLQEAARALADEFDMRLEPRGVERVPRDGPLLIVSNHPGAFDSVLLIAHIPRPDLKLIVSDVPFTRSLGAIADHLIYVDGELRNRMRALREMIRHLQAGGCAVIFGTGLLDPDPSVEPGLEQTLARWSGSLSSAAAHVPGLRIVPAIVSGVAARECVRSIWARARPPGPQRRMFAEFVQISQMLVFGRRFDLQPRLSFGDPIAGGGDAQARVLAEARALAALHGAA